MGCDQAFTPLVLHLGDYLSTLVNKPVSKLASTAVIAVSRGTRKSRGTGKSGESGDTCRRIQKGDIGSRKTRRYTRKTGY